jgi:hypothetical protein
MSITAREQILADAAEQGWAATDGNAYVEITRGDVHLAVWFNRAGAVTAAVRRAGQLRDQPRQGKREVVLAWLRHDDAPRRLLVEAAERNGWRELPTLGTGANLAFERGQLAATADRPASEQDGYEAVTVWLAPDGQVETAAATGWETRPRNDVLAVVLNRLVWFPPAERCARCGRPEHRHHLASSSHTFELTGPDYRLPQPAADIRAAVEAGQLVAPSAPVVEPVMPPASAALLDRAAQVAARNAAAATWSAQLAGRELRTDPPADDTLVLDVAAGTPDPDGVDLDELAGAIATLVGIARPDFAGEAREQGAIVTRAVRQLRSLADAHQARAASYRGQLREVTGEHDRAIERGQRAGHQVAQLAGKVRDLAGQVRPQDGAAGTRGVSLARPPLVDPALLSGDVSARQLVEAMAVDDAPVDLAPADHGEFGDQVVRLGRAGDRRLVGYLVGDQLVTALHGGEVVHPAGVAPYLAQLARYPHAPGTIRRAAVAREVVGKVERARRQQRAGVPRRG